MPRIEAFHDAKLAKVEDENIGDEKSRKVFLLLTGKHILF